MASTERENKRSKGVKNTDHMNTKEEIYTYVTEQTKKLGLKELYGLTASQIGLALNISRNLASQYLNELAKEGDLIKIISRPVYFLHKVTLESMYGVHLQDNVFPSGEDLKKELARGHILGKGFEKVIGRDESLHFSIEQMVSALGYPPMGLPVLISGERGSGKRYLSKIAYEYGLEQRILKENSRFVEVNCPEYAGNEQSFSELLFGNEEKEGILLKARGGMLYFNEISAFSEEAAGRLLRLEERREYYDAKNKVKRKYSGRMIFSTSEPVEKLNGRTIQRVPVIISLPPLEERSAGEKEQLIFSFLRNESKRIGKEILLSSQIIGMLMENQYAGNVEELQQVIRGSCARAYMDTGKGKDSMTLLLYHMPPRLVTNTDRDWSKKNKTSLIRLDSIEDYGDPEHVSRLFEELSDRMEQYACRKINGHQLIEESREVWQDYKKTEGREVHFFNGKVKVQLQVLGKLCQMPENPYQVILSEEALEIMGKLFGQQNYAGSRLIGWMHRNRETLERTAARYEREMPYEAAAYSWMEEQMDRDYQIQMSLLLKLVFLLETYSNNYFHFKKEICIMAAHGQEIARRMADYVNSVCLQKVVFPLNIGDGEESLYRQIEAIAYTMKPEQTLLIFMDLKLAQALESKLASLSFRGSFGIADQIGLKQLLTVGKELAKAVKPQEILKKLTQEEKRKTLFCESRKPLPTILFTSEMGIKTAEKFAEMFLRCLPGESMIQCLTYDYLSLTKPEQVRRVFSDYEIICVIGMMPSRVDRVPFISIENMISMADSFRIKEILEPYLTGEQIEMLIQGIVKDFTLQNVTRYLTILNPDKTLEFVHNALKEYQSLAGVFLSPRVVIGLSVHMCCMIERLVTKTPFEEHLNYQSFVEEEQTFIERMRKSMDTLCEFYHVEIPLGELAYIHDYIKNDKDTEDFYA